MLANVIIFYGAPNGNFSRHDNFYGVSHARFNRYKYFFMMPVLIILSSNISSYNAFIVWSLCYNNQNMVYGIVMLSDTTFYDVC